MSEPKTKPTNKSVPKYLRSIEHARRREDALTLLPLFEEVTGKKLKG